jgi:Ca2+:H+ antiporter
VIIALVVLPPDAAPRSARRDRVRTSLNLALGSAMAGIGPTVPAVALAAFWLCGPLVLGLGSAYTVLLALTVVVSSLSVLPGRATPLRGGVHLVLFAAHLEPAINPRPAARRPPAPDGSPGAARNSPG